jgi:transaldolase
MKFFVDTAEVEAIAELNALGIVDGVTTNPSLILKSGRDIKEVTREICAIVDGPVSAETVALDAEGMIAEGRELAKIAENIAIKVPLTWAGLQACKVLTDEGQMVNVTLCFTANQALLAAKVGATFISPFVGRLDDLALDGMDLIAEIRTIYDNYDYGTEILAASIRSANHMKAAALIGADVATAPPSVIKSMANHALTDKGLDGFMRDWAETGQKIL